MERVAEGGSGIHRREPASPDHRIVSRMALKSNDSPKLRGFESDSGPLSAFFRFWILPRFKEALSRLFSLIPRSPLSSTSPRIGAADSAGLGLSGE